MPASSPASASRSQRPRPGRRSALDGRCRRGAGWGRRQGLGRHGPAACRPGLAPPVGPDCGAAVSRYRGRVTVTVVLPGWEVRETRPPWACTIASTRARPRPAPPMGSPSPWARVRAVSPRANRSKAWSTRSGGKPGPSSWTEKLPPSGVAPARHGDGGAGGGVLPGVGQQVRHHLVQPPVVAGDLDRVVGQLEAPAVGRARPRGRRRRPPAAAGSGRRARAPAAARRRGGRAAAGPRPGRSSARTPPPPCRARRWRCRRRRDAGGPARCSPRSWSAAYAARGRRRRRTAAPAARCGAGPPATTPRGRAACSAPSRPGRPRCARR